MKRTLAIKERGALETAMILPLFLILAWASFWLYDLLDQNARAEHAAWTYSILSSLGYPESEIDEASRVNLSPKNPLQSLEVEEADSDLFDIAMISLPLVYSRAVGGETQLPYMVSLFMELGLPSSRSLMIQEESDLDFNGFRTETTSVDMDWDRLLKSGTKTLRLRSSGTSFRNKDGFKHLLWMEMTGDTDYPCLHPWAWGVSDVIEIVGKMTFGLPLDQWRKYAEKGLAYACPF